MLLFTPASSQATITRDLRSSKETLKNSDSNLQSLVLSHSLSQAADNKNSSDVTNLSEGRVAHRTGRKQKPEEIVKQKDLWVRTKRTPGNQKQTSTNITNRVKIQVFLNTKRKILNKKTRKTDYSGKL